MGFVVGIGSLAEDRQRPLEQRRGCLWFLSRAPQSPGQELAAINEVLDAHNLPPHEEPETVPDVFDEWRAIDGLPASTLFALQRVGPGKPHLKSLIGAGYLIPQDFAKPIYDRRLPSGQLGSSSALLRELQELAPDLGIRLQDGQLSDDEAERINDHGEDPEIVWLLLFEGARLSVKYRSAMQLQ